MKNISTMILVVLDDRDFAQCFVVDGIGTFYVRFG